METEALSVIKLPCHKNTCSYGSAKTSLPPVTHFESTATTTANILPHSTSHSESSPQDVVSFTTQRGKRGIKVDGVSYSLRHVRKSDGIMVWRCSRCYSVLETTAALQIIIMPDHKSTSCRPNPPATANTTAIPDCTASRPHFVQTSRKKTALLYEKHVYYSDSAKHWRCQYRKRMNCKAACHIKDNTVLSNNVAHVHRAKTDEEIRMFDVIADVKNKAVEQPEESHIIS